MFFERIDKVLNLKLLESLRTKEELIEYFKTKGQTITEEQIEILKESYENKQKNSNILNMKQLDNIAGGFFRVISNLSHRRIFENIRLTEIDGHLHNGDPLDYVLHRQPRNGRNLFFWAYNFKTHEIHIGDRIYLQELTLRQRKNCHIFIHNSKTRNVQSYINKNASLVSRFFSYSSSYLNLELLNNRSRTNFDRMQKRKLRQVLTRRLINTRTITAPAG